MRWALVDDALEVELCRNPCNEIGTETLTELERLADLLQDGAGGARALLWHSTVPKGFCAGADLNELYQGLQQRKQQGSSPSDSAGEVREFIDRIHRVFDTLDTTPLTTVAAVHGFCFGGGFELALTSDLIVADKSARFCFPELRLGLVPGFGGIPRLKRDVGNAVVRELLLTGRSIRAARAHSVGLVSQLVGRGHALEAARPLVAQSARFDAATRRAAKAFVKPLPEQELARERELFVERMTSPVVEQALSRFVQSTDAMPYLP